MPLRDSPSSIEDLLHHAEWVRRLAVRLAGPDDGDDAAQEAFLAAMRSPPRHRANLRGFFAALVSNALRFRARGEARRLRREAVVATASDGRGTEAAAATAERADLHRRLVTLVLDLDEPQRSLVLRHYFDGVDVATLAREHRCSADAVRAHLRRAREGLRRRLDAEPGTRRALVALAKFAAPTTTAAALPAITLLPVLAMKTKLILAIAGAAAAVWIVWPAVERPVSPITPRVAASATEAATTSAGPASPLAAGAPAERRAVEPVPTGTEAPTSQLRIRLRGLHPEAPWTAPVRLMLQKGGSSDAGAKHHSASGVPASDGTLAFDLPEWGARAILSHLRADDPRYLPVLVEQDKAFDPAQELIVDVQVVATFTGRVLDADGKPVPATRVAAFRTEDALPANTMFSETNTTAEGTFVLRAPPSQPLAIVAVAMHEERLGEQRSIGRDGTVADDGRVRADLLPTWVRANGGAAVPNDLGDVALPRPARLTGVVRWSDGPAIPGAYVNVYAPGLRTILLGTGRGHYSLVVRDDGTLVSSVSVVADDNGAFTVAAPAGLRMILSGEPCSGGSWNSFSSATTAATAPQHVDVVVARPIVLRVTKGGSPMGRATVRLEAAPGARYIGVQTTEADGRGEMWLQLGEQRVVVSAYDGNLRSAPRTLGPDDAGKQYELALDNALAEVRVEFAGDVPVHNTQLKWSRADGTMDESERLKRDDLEGPFVIHVEPGTWTLRAGPCDGERNGRFLMPVERSIEVPPEGLDVTLPAVFGGQLHVHATDSAGVHVAGSCRIVDGTGSERLPTFYVWSAHRTFGTAGNPGEVKAGGPNECDEILASGDYTVLLDFGALGSRRERVTIRPREVTELRVRL